MGYEGCAVILERDPEAWVLREHCWVIGKAVADYGWTGLDWRYGAVRVWNRKWFDQVLESADYPYARHTVLWNQKWPWFGARTGFPVLSCVQSVKSLLHIEAPLVQTVFQLEMLLRLSKGFRSIDRDTCAKLTGLRES